MRPFRMCWCLDTQANRNIPGGRLFVALYIRPVGRSHCRSRIVTSHFLFSSLRVLLHLPGFCVLLE